MALQNDCHRYFSPIWMRALLWVGFAASLALAALHMADTTWWSNLIVLWQLLVAAWFCWYAWLSSTRPLFVLSPSLIEVSHGLGGGGTLVPVPWIEFTGLKWENSSAICLARKDAPSVTLNLFLLSRRQRAAFRELVLQYLNLPASEPHEAAV